MGALGDVWDGSRDRREVRDGSGDPRRSLGRVQDPGGGPGWGTVGEVRDLSGERWGGPGMVGGPSGRSEMGRGTVGKVLDWSGDPRSGPGWVGGSRGGPGQIVGLFNRSETGRGSVGEVRNGSGNLGEVLDG